MALDFLMRVAAPFAGALAGLLVGGIVGESNQNNCDGPTTSCALAMGMYIGAGVGPALAMTLDTVVLAREPADAAPSAKRTGWPREVSIAPLVRIDKRRDEPARTVVGVAGTF